MKLNTCICGSSFVEIACMPKKTIIYCLSCDHEVIGKGFDRKSARLFAIDSWNVKVTNIKSKTERKFNKLFGNVA